jgi:hypothetical protein
LYLIATGSVDILWVAGELRLLAFNMLGEPEKKQESFKFSVNKIIIWQLPNKRK